MFWTIFGIVCVLVFVRFLLNCVRENARLNTLEFPRKEGIRADASNPQPWR